MCLKQCGSVDDYCYRPELRETKPARSTSTVVGVSGNKKGEEDGKNECRLGRGVRGEGRGSRQVRAVSEQSGCQWRAR